MHVKFYHRVCFQSTWRGGLEGGEHYYSPPGASPPLRGHRRKAGSRMGWRQPGPSSPGRERRLVISVWVTTQCPLLLPSQRQTRWLSPTSCGPTSLSSSPEPPARQPALSSPSLCFVHPAPQPSLLPLESHLLGVEMCSFTA